MQEEKYDGGLDPEVRELVDQTASTLESKGTNPVPISVPHTAYGEATYYILAAAEASSNPLIILANPITGESNKVLLRRLISRSVFVELAFSICIMF